MLLAAGCDKSNYLIIGCNNSFANLLWFCHRQNATTVGRLTWASRSNALNECISQVFIDVFATSCLFLCSVLGGRGALAPPPYAPNVTLLSYTDKVKEKLEESLKLLVESHSKRCEYTAAFLRQFPGWACVYIFVRRRVRAATVCASTCACVCTCVCQSVRALTFACADVRACTFACVDVCVRNNVRASTFCVRRHLRASALACVNICVFHN